MSGPLVQEKLVSTHNCTLLSESHVSFQRRGWDVPHLRRDLLQLLAVFFTFQCVHPQAEMAILILDVALESIQVLIAEFGSSGDGLGKSVIHQHEIRPFRHSPFRPETALQPKRKMGTTSPDLRLGTTRPNF